MLREMKYDLHIHSKYSHDGTLGVEEIIRIARQKGLSGIAITDHNTISGGKEAKRYETEDFQVIIGSEVMTDKGEIIGLFLSKEIQSRHFYEVITEIKAQDGIVIVPHPFDKLRHSTFHVTSEYVELVDAIEGFNSRCIFQKYNKEATEFAFSHNLPVVGGSDAHYSNEIGNGGITTQSENIKRAILNNDLEIFGKRSAIINHVRTKIRKYREKATK